MESKNKSAVDKFEECNRENTDLIGGEESDSVDSPVYVVGIGASAGGLEPLELLFDLLPPDTGMAFIVVQHLSPDFKSLMNEIMGRHTEMAVFRVTDRIKVRRNAIYLIPPGKEMIVSEGRLLLTDKDPNETLTMPIDRFFRSLANDCGTRGVAIVLSGSGSDGSRGVRDVHNSGGLVLTQDISAAFESMPMNAQESGAVDIVASVPEIANVLLRLSRHPNKKTDSGSETQPVIPEDGIKRMLREIRDNYGIDFTYYKPSTVLRRIERRLLMNQSDDLEAYVNLVVNDSEELSLLYKDLLIGVTQFFRDPEAFKILEEKVLPEILLRVPQDQELRIWAAGCATGEEAYSIAILLHERLTAMNRDINVKIFATDVHKASLKTASAGIYNKNSITNVSRTRLENYFTENANGYQISPSVRNMVVFAAHNLIKDAPFTKMDLISCRNMLIYLQPLAQKKVLSLFHFALKTGGTLFLGPSETMGDLAEEFESIDDHWRFGKKRRDIRLTADVRLPGGMGKMTAAPIRRPVAADSPPRFSTRPSEGHKATGERELMGVYNSLLEDFVPDAILVNEANELVHTFGNLDDILRIPTGPNSLNALHMLPADLRTVVVGAMQRVGQTGEPVKYSQVQFKGEDDSKQLNIIVRPVVHQVSNSVYTLISIVRSETDDKSSELKSESRTPLAIDNLSRERIDVLETQLRHNRESLQATIEELESSNEELQATNEEMVASNEELQSTNEELHSVNEELYTVNAEYQKKINELTEMTHDMNNLFNSTDVHTLFLDDTLSIRKFTPQMGQVFNLIPTDTGRRIEGFSHNIPCDDLMEKLAEVLNHGRRYEEEITMPEGNHFLLRIGPYRGETNRMGVVVTLLDITQSLEAESRFRATFDNAAVGIGHVEMTGRWLRVNDRLCSILGYSRKEMQALTFEDISFEADLDSDNIKFASLKRGEIDRYMLEKRCVRKDQSQVWVSQTISLQRDSTGIPQYSIVILQDISQRKLVETELMQAVNQRDQFLATLSHELRNPLAAARHAFSVASHDNLDADKQSKAMGVIDRQLFQMANLLDDLLDVARITQGKIRFETLPLDMRTVVQDAADALQATIKSHNHHFSLSVPDDAVVVEGDESRLLQVVENLLTNACKYTPDGGNVELSLEVEKNYCVLSIVDNGRGIDSELLGHVFDVFVQSDLDLDRQEGGMGLGLTVVRSLVEHHNGTIQAHSEGLGKGATFVVRLPLSMKAVIAKDEETDSDAVVKPIEPNRPIVVVEDNDDSREMLITLLELEGFEVVGCSDGRSGLDKIIELMPEIALVDIGLPEIDGYQLAKKFRSKHPHANVKLVALTGYGQESDVKESAAAKPGSTRRQTV